MLGKIAQGAQRMPWSIALMIALVVVHLVVGEFPGRLPGSVAEDWGYQSSDFLDIRWWNIFSTMVLSTSTASMLLGVVVAGTVLGLAEFTLGTWRTALLFCVTQLVAVVLYTLFFGLGLLADLDWPAGLDQATLLGPFAAAAGTLMAASQSISLLWRRRVRVLILALAVMLSVYVGHAQHVFILLAALSGLGLGLAFVRSVGPVSLSEAGPVERNAAVERVVSRSTSREARNILAMVVAVFAVGPLAAAVAHVAVGPLAVMRAWITNADPTLPTGTGNCQIADAVCHDQAHNLGLMDAGGHVLALMPMLLLLVCAEGLRRGNRLALWAAIYVHMVIGLVSAVYFQVFAGLGLPLRRGHRSLSINESVWDLLPVVLVPFLIAGALWLLRHHFRVDPDPVLRRRSLVFMPLILVVFVGMYSVAWLVEGNAKGPLGGAALAAGLPRIVLPYPFPFGYASSVFPSGFFSELLFSFGGPVLWFVSAMSILALFLSRRQLSAAGDREKAEQLVRRGGDSLSWMTLWDNNHYWFNDAASVAVGYQIHNGVAVTVGGPVGETADYAHAIDEFLEHCNEVSLTACFYSVNDDSAALLEQHGFRRIQVAAETLLDVKTMDFKGKAWQNVRTALNKASKLGVTALWCSYAELSTSQRTQVHEISEDWVSGQALPELGFTLGGLTELKDEHVQLCLAIDDSGRIHAVTSWLPVFSKGEIVSWTLDFMRRNSGAFNGVMEYLIAQAVQHFATTVNYISLSGSPLATEEPQDSNLARLLALLGRTLEPVYGFSSLANFKQRFQPRHRPLYLMYQDPLSLPAMGRAVGEAYMPNMSVRSLARVLRK